MKEPKWISQVPDASLCTFHALGLRQPLRNLASRSVDDFHLASYLTVSLYWLPIMLRRSPTASISHALTKLNRFREMRTPLRTVQFPVYASRVSFDGCICIVVKRFTFSVELPIRKVISESYTVHLSYIRATLGTERRANPSPIKTCRFQ